MEFVGLRLGPSLRELGSLMGHGFAVGGGVRWREAELMPRQHESALRLETYLGSIIVSQKNRE